MLGGPWQSPEIAQLESWITCYVFHLRCYPAADFDINGWRRASKRAQLSVGLYCVHVVSLIEDIVERDLRCKIKAATYVHSGDYVSGREVDKRRDVLSIALPFMVMADAKEVLCTKCQLSITRSAVARNAACAAVQPVLTHLRIE
jgi:hypothetical protein